MGLELEMQLKFCSWPVEAKFNPGCDMYNKIIVANDLSKGSQKLVDAALRLAGNEFHRLHLIHVVEPIAAAYNRGVFAVQAKKLTLEVVIQAKQRLQLVGSQLGIENHRIHIVLGTPATEIRNLANKIAADAIVIGSHGHSGWDVLLGSTASRVLNSVSCDVLTVRINE